MFFLDNLNRFGVSATLRRSLGDDIEGACGQLRNKELKDGEVVIKPSNVVANSRPKPNENTRKKVKDPSKLLQNKKVANKNDKKNNFKKSNKTKASNQNSKFKNNNFKK